MLSDGPGLWTPDLLDEMGGRLARGPGDADGGLPEAWLAGAPPACCRLAAEMLWVLLLFPSSDSMRAATKRAAVRDAWSRAGGDLAEGHPLLGDDVLVGVARPGPAYNRFRALELGFLAAAAADIKRRGAGERGRVLGDPWAFARWLHGVEGAPLRQLRHILPHLLFPDHFERISVAGHKGRILAAYGDPAGAETGGTDPVGIDRRLLRLRERLEREHGTRVDFYIDGFRERWRP